MTQRAWTLVQIGGELGVDRNTVRERLNAYGLRCTKPTAPDWIDLPSG